MNPELSLADLVGGTAIAKGKNPATLKTRNIISESTSGSNNYDVVLKQTNWDPKISNQTEFKRVSKNIKFCNVKRNGLQFYQIVVMIRKWETDIKNERTYKCYQPDHSIKIN